MNIYGHQCQREFVHFFMLEFRREAIGMSLRNQANLMYKCTNNLALVISVICLPREPRLVIFVMPRENYCFQRQELTTSEALSYRYSRALLWNNLPEEVRTATSLDLFKRSTQRWFSEQYSHTANM